MLLNVQLPRKRSVSSPASCNSWRARRAETCRLQAAVPLRALLHQDYTGLAAYTGESISSLRKYRRQWRQSAAKEKWARLEDGLVDEERYD